MTLRDSLIAAIVPIFLGFGFVIAKPAMEYLPPFLLMGLRFTFVALLLVWWFPIPRGFLKKIFFASLIANTAQYSITYTGLSFIDASAAVLLVQTEVPFGVSCRGHAPITFDSTAQVSFHEKKWDMQCPRCSAGHQYGPTH